MKIIRETLFTFHFDDFIEKFMKFCLHSILTIFSFKNSFDLDEFFGHFFGMTQILIIFGFVVEFVVYLNFHPIETHSSSYYAVRSITQFQVNSRDSKAFELHTVRNLHFLSKNSTLISRENCRFFRVKNS